MDAASFWRQKYGVQNSSGSTTSCAPALAALPINSIARERFPSGPRSHRICTSARVTGVGASSPGAPDSEIVWGSLTLERLLLAERNGVYAERPCEPCRSSRGGQDAPHRLRLN